MNQKITYSQACDILAYFSAPKTGLYIIADRHHGIGIFNRSEFLKTAAGRDVWDHEGDYEALLKLAGYWPDPSHAPELPPFVYSDSSVMRGSENIAACRSVTMARRISNALNLYKPGPKGY